MALIEVAHDHHVGLQIAGQVRIAHLSSARHWFFCFSMPSLPIGLRRWTTQMSIEVTALVSLSTLCLDNSRSRSDTRDAQS